MAYQPPKSLLEVLQKIQYEEPLEAGDPRYVETEAARGSEKTMARLAKKFGWDPRTDECAYPNKSHVLFFGHAGSGKTTELRRYAREFERSRRFRVIEVDTVRNLDINNLEYADVLMAMAEALVRSLQNSGHAIDDGDLKPLQTSVAQVLTTRSLEGSLSAEVRAEAEAGIGFLGLLKLLGRFSSAARTNAAVKKEWREEVKNRYTALAEAFNKLIRACEESLKASKTAERIVFLLDGTDKMRDDQTRLFFVQEAQQLLAIETFVVYAAPLYLKDSGLLVGQLDATLLLPMIKLCSPDGTRLEAGWVVLRELLLKRADRSLFAGDAQVDRLVEHSGGHPRELLRLLKLCCEYADDVIDAVVVESALTQAAADYRRFLEADDYERLVRIDRNPTYPSNDDRTRWLMYRLALLEYNDGGWKLSHPLVRRLEDYRNASQLEP